MKEKGKSPDRVPLKTGQVLLSSSILNMYVRCSAAYYYRYPRGLIIQPDSTRLIGTTVDRALSANFKQKIDSHKDWNIKRVLEVYDHEFTTLVKRGVEWERGESKPKVQASGMSLIQVYHKNVSPKIQPALVQPYIIKELTPQIVLQGTLDRVDTNRWVVDMKTSRNMPPMVGGYYTTARPDHDLQMVVYKTLYGLEYRAAARGAKLEYMVRKDPPVIVQVVLPPLQPYEQKYLLNLAGNVAHGIQTETYVPNRGHFLCSQKYCGYWRQCEKDFGGKVKL